MKSKARKGCSVTGCLGTLLLLLLIGVGALWGLGVWMRSSLPTAPAEPPPGALSDQQARQIQVRLREFVDGTKAGRPVTIALDQTAINELLDRWRGKSRGRGEPFVELEGENMRWRGSLALAGVPLLEDRHLEIVLDSRPSVERGVLEPHLCSVRVGIVDLPAFAVVQLEKGLLRAMARDDRLHEFRETVEHLHSARIDSGVLVMRSKPVIVPRGAQG